MVPMSSVRGHGMSTVEYRRPIGNTIWHHNPKCSDWPTRNFECKRAPPKIKDLCSDCDDPRPVARAERTILGGPVRPTPEVRRPHRGGRNLI
jgi:hypothetical protein